MQLLPAAKSSFYVQISIDRSAIDTISPFSALYSRAVVDQLAVESAYFDIF
jgi:hypothetical protein